MSGYLRYSLRGRLMAVLISSMGLLWLVAAVSAFLHALEETDELFDAQMVQASELLLGLVKGAEAEKLIMPTAEQAHPYRMPVFYQVLRMRDGRWEVLAHVPEEQAGLPPGERLTDGFLRLELEGVPWRIFVRTERDRDERLYRVVVGQRYAIREDLGHEFAEHLLIPLGVGFPVMALVIWWGIGRAMRPVQQAAGTVARMPVDRLGPIRLSEPCPTEIAPLLEAIDSLTIRVGRAIESERRFTADAAHELRTPLAGLRVQAQVAMRVADPVERARALQNVLDGVTRMTHLVEQMLALARLDPSAAGVVGDAPVDLGDVAAATCADLTPRALQRGQEIQLDAPRGIPVWLDETWARALIGNLVDNGLRYGRDGGRVEVEVVRSALHIDLCVLDDGPGVAEGERERLAERFYRGESDQEGCGLGLSIVARIVAAVHAQLDFIDGLPRADGGTGFGVRIRFASERPT
ncbi:MAG: sensor histidine kinase N-terminal domain-containing protein [Rhodocyclaceae bacterium]|nr:sensor histidine kinase N-terminal domain-containing protein [Rhodocyclaceae bacterium]